MFVIVTLVPQFANLEHRHCLLESWWRIWSNPSDQQREETETSGCLCPQEKHSKAVKLGKFPIAHLVQRSSSNIGLM